MDKNTSSNELVELKAKLAVYEQWHNESSPNQSYSADEIDLKELWNVIWYGKWKVVVITVVFSILSVFYAVSLPNVYKSEALLMPNIQDSKQGGIGALAGQFGGLASLAGINLGSGQTDKTDYALEVLKSREFLYKFIEDNDLKVKLMAVKAWDRATNSFKYDPSIYDNQTKAWVRNVNLPLVAEPSLNETYIKFLRENLTVSQINDTGMVKLGIKHFSPYVANDLTMKLIKAINATIKEQDMKEAEKSISYLNRELNNTTVSDARSMFFQLIEQHQQTLMLTKVRDDYVLKVVDKSVVAEQKFKPKRALICILGSVLGFMLSIVTIIFWHFFNRENRRNSL